MGIDPVELVGLGDLTAEVEEEKAPSIVGGGGSLLSAQLMGLVDEALQWGADVGGEWSAVAVDWSATEWV